MNFLHAMVSEVIRMLDIESADRTAIPMADLL